MSKEAMKLAKDFIESMAVYTPTQYDENGMAICKALEEALAKQKQGEPVTQTDGQTRPWFTIDELNEWADKYQNQEWRNAAIRIGEELASVGPDNYYNMEAKDWLDWAMANVQPSQPKQEQGEPVAWLEGETIYWKEDQGLNDWIRKNGEPLYTTPQQRTWVSLTDEQIRKICGSVATMREAVREAEAILKEGNI
jgi:hypothetical protein